MSKFTSHSVKRFHDDGYAYFRLNYNVPVMRGMRVKFEGKWGTIVGSSMSLIIRPDERKYKSERWLCHPTWHIEYFPTPDQAKESEARRQAYWAIAYPNRPYQQPVSN